jgi:hypothetical protein
MYLLYSIPATCHDLTNGKIKISDKNEFDIGRRYVYIRTCIICKGYKEWNIYPSELISLTFNKTSL